jgi:hypothetical protein
MPRGNAATKTPGPDQGRFPLGQRTQNRRSLSITSGAAVAGPKAHGRDRGQAK